jgi:hypothetical protein
MVLPVKPGEKQMTKVKTESAPIKLDSEEVRPLDDNELAAAIGGYRLANETAIKFAATIRKGGDPEEGGE